MTNFEIGVLIFIITMFLLVAIAPMAVNIWFFRQETKKRKKEIESKDALRLE
jgi:flagellar basal body-associated protein FliL